jgi:hypothetical protein
VYLILKFVLIFFLVIRAKFLIKIGDSTAVVIHCFDLLTIIHIVVIASAQVLKLDSSIVDCGIWQSLHKM